MAVQTTIAPNILSTLIAAQPVINEDQPSFAIDNYGTVNQGHPRRYHQLDFDWPVVLVLARGLVLDEAAVSVVQADLQPKGDAPDADQAVVLKPAVGAQPVQVVLLMVLKPLLVVLHHLALVPGLATVQEVDLGHPVLEHKVTLGAALLRAGEASVLAQANVVHIVQSISVPRSDLKSNDGSKYSQPGCPTVALQQLLYLVDEPVGIHSISQHVLQGVCADRSPEKEFGKCENL
mmetsp:Transcript_27154/g.51697  ORF Transcript_27154/g.51697 Transcript_27154/m.51697 type:complete len:234 (+) Transcript_27154:334-1035(+)